MQSEDTHMNKIKNVVFDMGGVLMDWDPSGIARSFAANEKDAQLLQDAVFGSPYWGLLDAGAVSEEAVAWCAKRALPERLHAAAEDMVWHWYDRRGWFADTGALVRRLANEGFGIYLLTNAGPAFPRYRDRIPAIELFDGVLVSCEEHLVKPDFAIYRLLCERFRLDPACCLFIDDMQVNVDAARHVGMRGYRFAHDIDALEHYIHDHA
jgi:FMN phosphatase YigB (HAD superfamily)